MSDDQVLFHDSMERTGVIARTVLEALEEGEEMRQHLEGIRNFMASNLLDVVTLRSHIADSMIQYGRYALEGTLHPHLKQCAEGRLLCFQFG